MGVCIYIYIHTLRFFSHLFHFKSRINVLLYWSISRRLAPVFEFYLSLCSIFPCGSAGKESACNTGDMGSITWLGKIPWRRERLPTPEFWPGEFHGLYSPWGRKESDTRSFHFHMRYLLHLLWQCMGGGQVGGLYIYLGDFSWKTLWNKRRGPHIKLLEWTQHTIARLDFQVTAEPPLFYVLFMRPHFQN